MATNMYIKFDGVDGESEDKNHAQWIEILNWSHGFSQPSSPVRASSGSTVEKANHSSLNFTKYMDIATKDLLQACWNGKQYPKVDIECFRSDGTDDNAIKYLMINMEQVVISNYSFSGGGGDIPIENLSLSYGKITYTYDSKKKDDGAAAGAKVVSHDLKTNEVSAQ